MLAVINYESVFADNNEISKKEEGCNFYCTQKVANVRTLKDFFYLK